MNSTSQIFICQLPQAASSHSHKYAERHQQVADYYGERPLTPFSYRLACMIKCFRSLVHAEQSLQIFLRPSSSYFQSDLCYDRLCYPRFPQYPDYHSSVSVCRLSEPRPFFFKKRENFTIMGLRLILLRSRCALCFHQFLTLEIYSL